MSPLKILSVSWVWWHMPIIPVLKRLRQKDHKLETSLGYIVRSCYLSPNPRKKKSLDR